MDMASEATNQSKKVKEKKAALLTGGFKTLASGENQLSVDACFSDCKTFRRRFLYILCLSDNSLSVAYLFSFEHKKNLLDSVQELNPFDEEDNFFST